MTYNNEDILTLAKAGFTAQQIAALSIIGRNSDQAPAPAPIQAPAPAPAPVPIQTPAVTLVPAQPAPVAAPTPEPAPAPAQGATVDDVLAAINGLGATFQHGFMQAAEQPEVPTAESILAEIINPPQLDVNKK